MNQNKIRITSIGHIANQVLRRSQSALVSGTTSQGIYLQPSGDLTLYLSCDPFRGPLTVNIRDEGGGFPSIQPFDVADLIDDRMTFRVSKQAIDFYKPLIWKPTLPPSSGEDGPAGFARIAHQARMLLPNHPYHPLLEIVTEGTPIAVEDFPGIEDRIIQLSKFLAKGNPSDIISEMKLILGAGPGLTPLGDDLLLGILLTITRTRRGTYWPGDLIHFYHTVITEAEEKTTRLSWSLLNCAVQGTADERIIRVLDGLIAGREIPNPDLESLLNWGSSSGIAVLAGMILALT